MDVVITMAIGYLFGTLSPAALLSKLKATDLRTNGTGNLGATNAMLVFGKAYGAIVMLLDFAKTIIAVNLCQLFFPAQPYAGWIAGASAVIGHIYPFYMGFKGGKGLAALGGLALAKDPFLFLIVVLISGAFMILTNCSVVFPLTAATAFPILSSIRAGSAEVFLITAAACAVIILNHRSNIERIRRGGEKETVREHIMNHWLKRGERERE